MSARPATSTSGVHPRQLLTFLLFSLLLFLPFRQVWKSLDQSRNQLEQQKRFQAQESTNHILTLLGQDHRNMNLLIEEQLEELGGNLLQAFAEFRRAGTRAPFPEAVHHVFAPATASLSPFPSESPASRFSSILIQQYQFVPEGHNRDSIRTVFCHGLEPDQRQFMEELFTQSLLDFITSRTATPPAELQEKLSRFIPGMRSSTVFDNQFRGRLTPIVFGGKPFWIYHQVLLDVEHMGPCDMPLPTYPDFVNLYEYRPDTRRSFLVGNIVLLLPRSDTPWLSSEDLIRYCSRRGTALALIPPAGHPVVSPEFSAPVLAAFLQQAMLPESPFLTREAEVDGYALGTGHTFLGQSFRVIAATPHRAPDLWFVRKEAFLRIGTSLLFFLMLGLLYQSVLRGGALAGRLSHQLATGFLLASLMPLALAFDLTEQSFQQRSELLEARYRYLLRERLQEMEDLVLLTRQMARQSISLQARATPFLTLLQSSIASSSSAASFSLRVQMELQTLYENFSSSVFSRYIHRVSSHRLILSGQGQRWTVPEEGKTTERDSLAAFLSFAADNLLEDLYGKGSASEQLTQEVKREMILDEFVKLSASVLDPSSVFFMLKGADDLLAINTGQGNRYIHRLFLPSATQPSHLLYVFTGRSQEAAAARRIIGAPLKFPGSVYTARFPQQAYLIYPADGMRFGFIRNIFRSLTINPVLHSMTIEHEGRTLLLEGWPGKKAHSLAFMGFIDRDEILKKEFYTQLAQQTLILLAVFIILFLAVHSTGDFLLPVQRLSGGLLALQKNDFSVYLRVDRTDELGQLCHSFNGLARHLHEGQMLGRMVSGRARKAMQSLSEENDALEGHRTLVTIAYVSLLGVEQIGSQTDPDVFIKNLSCQIGLISQIAASFGGETDKVMGGKVLLVFGLEEKLNETGLNGAVRFAAALLACHATGELPSAPAIGINHGPVISGLLGSGTRRDFTVIGDTVNLAARLSSFAETLTFSRVVLPESALRFLSPQPSVQSLGGTHIKGKSQEVEAIQLLLDPG